MEIQKQIQFSKTEEDSVRGWNQDNILNKKGMFCDHFIPDRIAYISRSEECWSCGVFLTREATGKDGLHQKGMKVQGSYPMKDALWN
jgi:hypothetical protein